MGYIGIKKVNIGDIVKILPSPVTNLLEIAGKKGFVEEVFPDQATVDIPGLGQFKLYLSEIEPVEENQKNRG
ncbi:MAG: hypothetical protein DRP08_02230 [Candidatus Aenigmatarchaeota archaeon]|nr:MAG: hypothetical protein DRP08_02230 [Candidatus Aenigmarchaeota archaeon]